MAGIEIRCGKDVQQKYIIEFSKYTSEKNSVYR